MAPSSISFKKMYHRKYADTNLELLPWLGPYLSSPGASTPVALAYVPTRIAFDPPPLLWVHYFLHPSLFHLEYAATGIVA
jgi:hypothetical protein